MLITNINHESLTALIKQLIKYPHLGLASQGCLLLSNFVQNHPDAQILFSKHEVMD